MHTHDFVHHDNVHRGNIITISVCVCVCVIEVHNHIFHKSTAHFLGKSRSALKKEKQALNAWRGGLTAGWQFTYPFNMLPVT